MKLQVIQANHQLTVKASDVLVTPVAIFKQKLKAPL